MSSSQITATDTGCPSATGVTTALVTSIGSMEASRRVGWAKAFEARRREESVIADLDLCRTDQLRFASLSSYLFGILSGLNLRPDELLPDDLKAYFGKGGAPFRQLSDDERQIGNRVGRSLLSSGIWKAARDLERQSLCLHYGFTNQDEMVDWLSKFRKQA